MKTNCLILSVVSVLGHCFMSEKVYLLSKTFSVIKEWVDLKHTKCFGSFNAIWMCNCCASMKVGYESVDKFW